MKAAEHATPIIMMNVWENLIFWNQENESTKRTWHFQLQGIRNSFGIEVNWACKFMARPKLKQKFC